MKLADQLARLQRVTPKRDQQSGFLFRSPSTLRRRYKQVTFHVLIVSDENTHMIHSAQFTTEDARSPREWRAYFDSPPVEGSSYKTMIEYIYALKILPGIAVRTQKNWGIQRWIGFTAAHYDLHKPKNAPVDRKRNQAKSQRRTRG
jgi:hypothetical protein